MNCYPCQWELPIWLSMFIRETGVGIKMLSNGDVLPSNTDDEMHILLGLIQTGSVATQKGDYSLVH